MEHFQPNPNLYTIRQESFTSDDEFIADKRVHVTNEIPPEDLFDKVHSKLKNDFWEWFLGSTKLSFASDGIVYNLDTNGAELFDTDNNILEPSIAKYINGNRAKDYGPLPQVVFNAAKNDYEIVNQSYNRFEIEGTMMPEFDFLLHEGYRYLNTLYPDHPDFTEILTTNEINDELLHAAAIVHYNPNVNFFDWISKHFEYDVSEDQLGWIQNKEALKLKIRNLRNNTFRRKLYGAKAGYKMFGSEIFQHIMIYPIAEYLPFLPKEIPDKNPNYNEGNKKFTWFRDIFNTPKQFKNDNINRYNRLYKKVFRLVDWDNSSYDYEHQYVPPSVVYGTAYPTPLSNYDLYEWPIDRDWKTINGTPITYVPPSIANDFYEGQKIKINDKTTEEGYRYVYINTILPEDTFRVQAYLNYDHNEFLNRITTIPESITRIQIDGPAYPLYTLFDVYPSIEKTLQKITDHNYGIHDAYKLENPSWNWPGKLSNPFIDNQSAEYAWLTNKKLTYYDLSIYDSICNDDIDNKLIRSIRALYELISDHKQVKFTLEPIQDGNLFIPAQYLMTCYENWLNITLDTTNVKLIYKATGMSDDAYVNVSDLIIKNLNNESIVSELVGLEGGVLKFDITKADPFSIKSKATVDQLNEEEIGKYGIVIKFHKNNEVSAGKLAVVFGRPRVTYTDPDKNSNYYITHIDLELQAIPKVKSHELMLALYSNYESICKEKFINLETLFNSGSSLPQDNIFKNYYKRYSAIQTQMTLLLPAFEVLIKLNKDGYVHPNDSYWQKVKSPFLTIINLFDLRPILKDQIEEKYSNFIDNTDTEPTIKKPDIFEANCRDIIKELQIYNEVYFTWIFDIVSIDLDRTYYETLDDSRLRDPEKLALRRIRSYDAILNDMLANRAYLLKPMPSDLWMKEVDDGESSYSLLYRQDEFVSLLEYGINSYNDLITFNKNPIYGTNGVLTDFKFGSLNSASIVNNDEDVIKVPWEYFASTRFTVSADNGEMYGKDYLQEYSLKDYTYITLNKDILLSVAENTENKKFSYATPLFLELFLPQAGINNISGEIIPPYKVEIRSITTKDSNIISFIDEESIARLACISTGDKVIGNGVEDDIFVDYIDYEKNQIRVKKTNLNLGEADFTFESNDDKVLTYLCKMNLYAKDISKDFFTYRTNLSKNNLLDYGSLFAHGPFDQYSNTYLNGVVDVSHFVEKYKANLKSQSLFKQFFNKFAWDLYNNGESASECFVIPSIVNCVNKLFVEIGAYKRYDITEYNTETKTYEERYYTDQYIMKREILDYFQESLSEISKSSDLVNLGVNVIAATSNDGSISQVPNEEFTDPKIKLKFATYNWSYESMPYYIDIGIGELKSFWNRSKEEFEDQKRYTQDHSYYNYDIYGDKDSGSGDVGYWSEQYFETLDLYNLPIIDKIDKPIMRVYLGEYEVQKLINFDQYTSKKYTTVQFSIIKQIFKNLERRDSALITVLNENYFTHEIFKNITSFNEKFDFDGNVTTIFAKTEFNNYYYLGVWKPAKDLITNKIIYPEKIVDSFNVIYYYVIDENITLIDYCEEDSDELQTKKFAAGTVIILNGDKWEYKEFVFTGLLGNINILKANLNLYETEEVNIKYSFPPEFFDATIDKYQNKWPDNNLTLKHRLLFKLVCSLNILGGTELLRKKLSAQELEDIYDWTINELNDSNVHDYALKRYGIDVETLEDLYKKRIDKDLISILPTEFKNTFNLDESKIFWFLYTIGDRTVDPDPPTSWQLFEDYASIARGTAFALVYINQTFKITILNENEFLFKINSNNLEVDTATLIDKYEFNTFIGQYGHQKDNGVAKFFLYEKLKLYQNSIDLNYRYLLEGSLNVKFDLHPHFLTSGWKYNDLNQLAEKVDNIDLTEDKIYYDEDNNKLYTYNLIDNEKVKLAIEQEEHKFFKNLLFIYGSYAISTRVQDNKYIQAPEITHIEGIKFDADYLSLLDRILSIEQINVRSLYDINLESILYSSYCNIKGILKGIFIDENTDKYYLNIGFDDAEEPVLTANKLKFATELLKILPTRDDGDLKEDELYFDYNDDRFNTKWLDTNERIFSPEVKKFNVTKLISNVETEKIFSYYKNTLVLEGEIDLYTPNYISFNKNPRLKDALNYLRIDDTIQSIYFLEESVQEAFTQINWPSYNVKFMDYRQDKLLLANEKYFLMTDAFKTISTIKSIENDTPVTPISGKGGYTYTSLDSVAYEKQNNRWLLSLSNENNLNPYSDIIQIKLDDNVSGLQYGPCYNTTGINADTYQMVTIMETNDSRSYSEVTSGMFSGMSGNELSELLETYGYNKIFEDQISGLLYVRDISIVNADITANEFKFDRMRDADDNYDYISGYMVKSDDKVSYEEYKGYIFESIGHLPVQDRSQITPGNNDSADGTIAVNGGGIWKTANIAVAEDEYKIVNMVVEKLETTEFSDTTLTLGCIDNVTQMWVYDKITEKWTVATATLYNHNFLNGYGTPLKTNIICYLMGQNYGLDLEGNPYNESYMGMNFWKLPRPEVTDNIVICAFVVNKSTRLKITINRGVKNKPGRFLISNFTVKDPIIVNTTDGLYEGPYDPTVTTDLMDYKTEKFTSKKWVASNQLDNEAIVIGSTLFMYTPTKKYNIIVNEDGVSGLFEDGVTEFNHWKRAELPSEANITYLLFDQVEQTLGQEQKTHGTLSDGLLQVYDLVYSNYEYVRKILSERIPALSGIVDGGYANAEFEALKAISGWLANPDNKPKQYTTEEDIPIVISHDGVELLYTENGRIPNFTSDGIIRWNAPQDILVELGLSSIVYLKKQNYLRYLADYYSIILGTKRFKPFFAKNNIKDIKLTNTDLIFHTTLDDLISLPLEYTYSREDIENYNKWNISNIGEEYVFSSNIAGQYTSRTIGIDGVYVTVDLFPVVETTKAFTILEKYVSNNVHIYAGYVQVNNAVQGVYDAAGDDKSSVLYLAELFPNNRNSTTDTDVSDANWKFSMAKYPIILYSQDNGKHFVKWAIPSSNEIGLKNDIKSFNLENPGDHINNPSWEACQIYQIGSELRITLRKALRNSGTEADWVNVGYVSCYVKNNKDTTEILFNDNIVPFETKDVENDYLQIIRNYELNAGVKVYYASNKGKHEELSESDVCANYFFIKKPFAFDNLDKPKITQIDDNGVTFQAPDDLDLESENLRVLVSIDPYDLIENNTTYLDYKTEYLNAFGEFVVPTFIEVSSIDQANRLYSKRECMTAGPVSGDINYARNEIPKKGIPAISEDTDYSVYQYYSPFVNSKGETITNYIEATNSAGQIVKLCRLNGEYLSVRDSPTNNNYFTWASMILNSISYEALVAAPVLQEGYEATVQDEDLNKILSGSLDRKVTINYINFTNNNPQLDLDIFNIESSVIKKLIDKEKFYESPYQEDTYYVTDDWKENDLLFYKADYNGPHIEDWEDWAILREKIEAVDGPFNIKDKKIWARFDIRKVADKWLFVDLFTNTIILKEQNMIETNFNVPYVFKNGQQVYNNYTFNLSDDNHTLSKYEESYPITSVHIPSKGYGGSLNNASWDKIRPEENDYQAFRFDENKNPYLTRNDEKDYIYLADQNGIKLLSRNGLFWLETNEQIEITYNKLFAEKQLVKFYQHINAEYDYEDYQNEPSVYNFYKLPLTPISIYVPKRITDENNEVGGKVWLNNPCIDSTKIPVTVFKIHKAGHDQSLDDYEFTFSDVKGPLEDFEYDSTKQLIVWKTNGSNIGSDNRPIIVPTIHEKIIVEITNSKTNQKTSYNLYVQSGIEKGFVLDINSVLFNDKEFLTDYRFLTIEFEEASYIKNGLNNADTLYSNDQSILLESNKLNKNIFTLDFKEYPLLDHILFNNEPIYLDIRDYDIHVLTNKDWISSDVDDVIKYSLYTGDQLLQDERSIKAPFEVKYDDHQFGVTLTPELKDLTSFEIDSNIFTWNEQDIVTEKKFAYYIIDSKHYFSTVKPQMVYDETDSKVLISGLPGNIIMNYPQYKNFKDLIDNKLQIIEYKVPKILAVHPMDNEVTEIDPNFISFKIKNEIDNIDLTNPYLKIKILPVQTVYPEVRYLNNPEYIQEVDTKEKDIFGFDRVWINESLTSNPPIVYRNFLYNESSDYFTNTWKNKDGYVIYLANKEGKFVRPGLVNGLLKFIQLDEDTNNGDCRPYIYGNIDPRFNLPELILKTSVEKYLNNFYVKNLEINPLILTLNIKDEYDTITQKFKKVVNIYSKKKSNNTIEYYPVDDSYITSISQNILYEIKDKIYQNKYDNYFDYENGLIKFVLRGSDKNYKLKEVKYFYGIKYDVNNDVNNLMNNLVIRTQLNNDLRSDFYINTKEDLTDKKNKDHAIVEITEVGIFDKYNHLCAYLSHPKIQYRSDSTHLSYSLIIDEGGN
jgi:hypothetical protein